jgi:predicted transcriptional regulator of viral defense system
VGDKSSETGATHQPLAELATQQHGVVSTRQLARLGYTRSSASKANGVGRLHRVHRGVYRVGHKNLTWEGQCMAAVLAAAPQRTTLGHRGVVASHFAAAWLWDVIRFRPQTIHVTVMTRRRLARRPFVVHEEPLRADDMAVREGIPVTSPPRTYLDLAATERGRTVARMLERAGERNLFDLGPVREVLKRHPDHPGASKLEDALDLYRETPVFTRSGLERRFLELVREAGLPEPAMNTFVGGHEIDAYWEAERFAVELDVYETHGSRLAFEDNRARDDEVLLAGIETTRVTGPRLDREPDAVIDSLRRHLARRAGIK